MRLFLALDISSALRENLRPVLEGLRADGISPVGPEQVHVTIKFLGEVDEEGLAFVKGRLGSGQAILAGTELMLKSRSFDSFGSPPRVLWLGLAENHELKLLFGEVERRLAPRFPKEERSFSPHLTLARVKRWTPAAEKAWKGIKGKELVETWIARELVLYKSTLTPEGVRYERMNTSPFQ